MKQIKLILLFITALTFGNATASSIMNTPSKYSAPELKIKVSEQITINGCKFQVEGWIDVTFSTLFGFELNSYDLYATGLPPCGNYHFQGLTTNPRGSDDFDPASVDTDAIVTSIISKGI